MFKIIALIAYLRNLATRISFWLDDLRERVIGAALNATSERIVINSGKYSDVTRHQKLAAQQATDDLDHDLKLAYDAYSKALNVIGTVCDSQRSKINDTDVALRAKRVKLRDLLGGS